MDATETGRAYRRRADAREADRRRRYEERRRTARDIATELRSRYGTDLRVHLFGSLVDLDRFRRDSDIDIAVEGLDPAEYWEAWRVVDRPGRDGTVDLVRLETASASLKRAVREEGELLP